MARAENKKAAPTATRLAADIARILRQHAKLTQENLGKKIGYTGSAISAMETGAQPPSEEMLLGLEEVLGQGLGIFREAVKYIQLDRYPRQFADFALIEMTALTLCSYQTMVVDGLFQTVDYAEALIGGGYPPLPDPRVRGLVEARIGRKTLFSREPIPLIELILEESVLRRVIGSPAIMRDQLEFLIQCTHERNVTIQVLPLDRGKRGEHAGVRGPMKLVETPEHQHLVYLEPQDEGLLISDPAKVSTYMQRYAKIRAQALGPDESMGLIEQLAGER
ncbi:MULTISPECIES: helix-turn-helix domain-containing protein [Streptomyces]|uniref:XRE family transcriptional regulator n=1 Tax=Streptomyces kasugaensis TaxID=1946 RepID=A0A4Q9HPH4_STRKA|nr:helix-turn-helix transcriptional regulator [Streptomyces kasugaensis]TBO56565.1 XRE family transcriptional regulator [Streptomyces kasugaensis]